MYSLFLYKNTFLFLFVLVVIPLSSTKAIDETIEDREIVPCPGDGNFVTFKRFLLTYHNFLFALDYIIIKITLIPFIKIFLQTEETTNATMMQHTEYAQNLLITKKDNASA